MFFISFPKTSESPLGVETHAWVMSGPVDVSSGNAFETHVVVQS